MRRIALLVLSLALLVPAAAHAHIERASYWPDPAADCSITPCTGGKVPKLRSLASALRRSAPGRTRVVCQDDSMTRLRSSIRHARRNGYDIRPYDHRSFSRRQARRLRKANRRLVRLCRFHDIQPAVTASHNNDRVVVLPGVYTEPASRAAATNDPACAKDRIVNDKGSSGAVSYAYQLNCPNDQNLIAVLGRAAGPGDDPSTPLVDRHGIPNLGPCIRCNLQLEGSGVNADDVVVDAGNVASGDRGPRGSVKDVGIRADRADGFVLRNMKIRHAKEHDIYVLESDGYRLDRFKTYWGGEYGVLTFVEDHGLMSNCEAMGSGDSGLYPGAGARARAPRPASVATPARRFATRSGSRSATPTTTRAATPAPMATPRTSTTTTSTTTRSASRPTSSRRPATPGSRRTQTSWSTTTSSPTTTTRTPTRARATTFSRASRSPSGRGCGSRAATTTSSASTTSTTTGGAA